jgi:tetratricopeptide (TPR) repeat protein
VTTKRSKNPIPIYMLCFLFTAIFLYACWFCFQDSIRVHYPGSRVFRKFHSAPYYANLAYGLQYRLHDPSEVESLYENAIHRAPANWNNYIGYANYLESKSCCKQKIADLMGAATETNPSLMRLYPAVVRIDLEVGNRQGALHYFQKAIQLDPGSLRELIPVLAERESYMEVLNLVPHTEESLAIFAQYLSRQGSDAKETWLLTIQELHKMPVDAAQNLRTAEQALKMYEFNVAKQYAQLALSSPATEERARKILAKVEKRENRQEKLRPDK